MELHWLLFLVITILMANSGPCVCDTPNDDKLKGTGIETNNIKQYSPTRYIVRNDDDVGQGMRDRRGKYIRLRRQEKQDAKKLKKLKTTLKKVLSPLLRLLRDDHDDSRVNYTEENSSGQGLDDRRVTYLQLRQQDKREAKKLKKLQATIKKVLTPVLRLLRDDLDDGRDNFTEEDSS